MGREFDRRRRVRAVAGGFVVVGALVASIAASPGLAHADPPGGVPADPARFVPTTPARLWDASRPVGVAPEAIGVLGRSGMPAAGVRAVVLSVTARSATPGAVTLWSGEGAPPAVPTLTTGPDRTATTTAIVPVGPDGRIDAVAAPAPGGVALTADVTGWFPLPSTVVAAPARLFASRGDTVDGRDARSGPVTAGTVRPLAVDGRGPVPPPAGSSVLLAVHSARAQGPSALTLWPGGTPQPVVPSAPVAPSDPAHPGDRSDLVLTAVGRDGRVDMALAEGAADVDVDLVAVLPPGSAVRAPAPERVVDTRPGTVTVDGRDGAAGALAPGVVRRIPLAGRAGVPAGATAVLAHLTATTAPGTTAPAELRAWSDAAAPAPPGPAVVAGPGETRGGLVVLPLAPDGSVALRSDGAPTDVAVDVQGWIGDAGR